MNLSSYVPKANVDYTISGHGTGISTLDHSATTPRACAPVTNKGEFNYTVNYSSECFTMRWDSKKAELI